MKTDLKILKGFFMINNSQPFNYNSQRYELLSNEVKDVAKAVGFEDQEIEELEIVIPTNVSPLDTGPASCDAAWKIININHLWLVEWDDLPEQFKIHGPDDPNLEDRDFIQQFSDYIAEKFNLEKKVIGLEDICMFRCCHVMNNDIRKTLLAFRCMIAHELGHIKYPHTSSVLESEQQADKFAAENLDGAAEGAKYGFDCAKEAINRTVKSKVLTTEEKEIAKKIFKNGEVSKFLQTHGSMLERYKAIAERSKKPD
jgi:hypothetical protein